MLCPILPPSQHLSRGDQEGTLFALLVPHFLGQNGWKWMESGHCQLNKKWLILWVLQKLAQPWWAGHTQKKESRIRPGSKIGGKPNFWQFSGHVGTTDFFSYMFCNYELSDSNYLIFVYTKFWPIPSSTQHVECGILAQHSHRHWVRDSGDRGGSPVGFKMFHVMVDSPGVGDTRKPPGWRFPQVGVPPNMDGLFVMENPIQNGWWWNGGTPMTKRKPPHWTPHTISRVFDLWWKPRQSPSKWWSSEGFSNHSQSPCLQ